MISWNQAVGAYLKNVLRCRDLSAEELAPALGVHPRTVFNWMSGKGRPDEDQEAAIRLCLGLEQMWPTVAMNGGSGEDAPFVDWEFNHPHRKLVKVLVNGATCGMQKEVLGPPGVFKTAVLRDVERRIVAECGRSPGDCIYLSCREDLGGPEGFWNALGQRAEPRDIPYTYADLSAHVSSRKCVLLLDHLDEFLLHLRFRFANAHDFARIACKWMADLKDLRAAVIAASTIHTAAHVGFVAPTYPSSIYLTPQCYARIDDAEWNLWTVATLVRFGQGRLPLEQNARRLARELKKDEFRIPLVFRASLAGVTIQKDLQYKDRLRTIKGLSHDTLHMLGGCIWNRIPDRARHELFSQNFSLPPENRIAVALRNSGILLEGAPRVDQQRSVLKPLVPAWIEQWRREAVI